jgi:hypothetical protein
MLDNHDTEEKPFVRVRTRADELNKKREAWEKGSYQRSNEELYEILDECLQFYREIANNPRKVAALNEYLGYKKIKYTDTTSLETKIVRVVFNSNFKKRAYAYARVISVAVAEMELEETLSEFITKRGGVEEIRKKPAEGKSAAEQRKNRIQRAKEAFGNCAPLAEPFEVKQSSRERDPGRDHMLFVAIMREEPNGSYSMVYETGTASLMNAALDCASNDNAIKDAERSAKERQRKNEFDSEEDADLAARLSTSGEPQASAG